MKNPENPGLKPQKRKTENLNRRKVGQGGQLLTTVIVVMMRAVTTVARAASFINAKMMRQ